MNNTLVRNVQRPPGQGQSKSARRRRRRRQVVRQVSVPTSSPAVPLRRRRRVRRVPQVRNSFVHCVLDPFNHSGPLTGVPDRYSGLSLVIENRTLKTFTTLKHYNYFLIIPSLGANLVYQFSDNEIPAFETKADDKWMSVDPTIDADDACTDFTRFRTIALAAKVRYIGPAAVRNGWFRVSRFSWQTNNQLFKKTTGTAPNTVDNRVVEFDTLDITEQSIMALPSAVSMPVEQGVYTSSVRNGADSWNFADVEQKPYAISTDDCSKTAPTKITSTNFTISSYDSDWAGLIVFYGCGTPSSSYFGGVGLEIDVRHCVEAIPALTSDSKNLRTLARQSPKHDQGALDQVSDIQRELPAAIPHSESWLARFAKGVGRFAFNVGTGFVGPMVEMVTSGMNAMGLGGRNSVANSGFPALM